MINYQESDMDEWKKELKAMMDSNNVYQILSWNEELKTIFKNWSEEVLKYDNMSKSNYEINILSEEDYGSLDHWAVIKLKFKHYDYAPFVFIMKYDQDSGNDGSVRLIYRVQYDYYRKLGLLEDSNKWYENIHTKEIMINEKSYYDHLFIFRLLNEYLNKYINFAKTMWSKVD